jgi:thiamine kinase-like enzyme
MDLPKIHLQEDLQKLLYGILKKKKENKICIHPFKRYGMSGSGLYLVYFSEKEDDSVPHVLKTFEKINKFKKELKGMELINKYYHIDFTPLQGKLSGILLKHSNNEIEKVKNSITLADMLHKKDKNEKIICNIINKTFNSFGRVYKKSGVKIEECDIKKEYYRYLRDNKTRDIVEKLVGNIKNEKIVFNGKSMTNPVYIFEHLIERTKMTKLLIHGDFHPNNIVIDDYNVPRIIDFAWSCKKDIYIDFSMFEMSVRYWNSPLLECKAQKALDGIFLHENIKDYEKNIEDYKENQDVQRIITVVHKIRDLSKTYIPNYDFKHHLLSQFIVLYGLQAYTAEFNPFIVIPFLAKLGDEIKRRGYAK